MYILALLRPELFLYVCICIFVSLCDHRFAAEVSLIRHRTGREAECLCRVFRGYVFFLLNLLLTFLPCIVLSQCKVLSLKVFWNLNQVQVVWRTYGIHACPHLQSMTSEISPQVSQIQNPLEKKSYWHSILEKGRAKLCREVGCIFFLMFVQVCGAEPSKKHRLVLPVTAS